MRALSCLVAICLLPLPVLAADSKADPLAPGKPSGVKQAQGFVPNYPVLFLGALGLAAIGGYYLASHNPYNATAPTGTSP